jgi:hypothetical protein
MSENVEFVRAIVGLYEQPEAIAALAAGTLDLSLAPSHTAALEAVGMAG